MITLDKAGKSFGGKWAVKGLDIRVEKGEIFGLLGPNAAGKTTTIRMMTGLLKPTEGEILIGGYNYGNIYTNIYNISDKYKYFSW